jgi:hypothetical protein
MIEICENVPRNDYVTAIIGLVGVLVGFLGNVVTQWLKERSLAKKDRPRKRLLLKMLEDNRFPQHWRSLDTLMHVIGANEETTKRLLLEIGARGSEDQQELWGLVKFHPFEKQ